MRIVPIAQNTEEWSSWRTARACASETPALMGCSPWEPKTPNQLFMHKSGFESVRDNAAMARGRDLESMVRNMLSDKYGRIFSPACVEREIGGIPFGASLDGILDGLVDGRIVIAEIKCPGSFDPTADIPEHYMLQMQHQLLVSEAGKCIYAVYHEFDLHTFAVLPDPAMQSSIIEAWGKFWPLYVAGEAPPLQDGDFQDMDFDTEWHGLARDYRTAYAALKRQEQVVKDIKAELEEQAQHQSAKGAGIRLAVFWQKGRVDYAAVPVLAGIDLEPYRKIGQHVIKITLEKEGGL